MKTTEKYPHIYLGLSSETFLVVSVLEKHTKCSKLDIFVVLRKIKLNESLDNLAVTFGLDRTSVSRIFRRATPLISAYVKQFVHWPSPDVIKANLPYAFRANYADVQSIIDCFETEIEKPSNALHQAQTWSSYKNCNTVKNLVCATPNGLINFVSGGYAGRMSDQKIIESCGLLEILKPGTVLMADRGFKHIEGELVKRQCRLVRPPSVTAVEPLSEEEVRFAKIVASLRVHIERVIQRIRVHEFLSKHSCFHHDVLCQIDNIVLIVCGLCNLRNALIKK